MPTCKHPSHAYQLHIAPPVIIPYSAPSLLFTKYFFFFAFIKYMGYNTHSANKSQRGHDEDVVLQN